MTRDEIIRMAREADCMHVNLYGDQAMAIERLTRFAALVAAAEREACAKLCDQRKIITPEWQLDQHYNQGVSHCAAAIRARDIEREILGGDHD